MANKNIDDLPTATSWNAGDKLEILQGGTNKQIDASLLGAVQSVTGPQVDDTDPLNPIVEQLGLIQIVDLAGEFFTDLATARAYIQTFTSATLSNESFENGIYFFTVPPGSDFSNANYFLGNNASTKSAYLVDHNNLISVLGDYSFKNNSGNNVVSAPSFGVEAFAGATGINIVTDSAPMFGDDAFNSFGGVVTFYGTIVNNSGNYFGQSATGKFIILGKGSPLSCDSSLFMASATSTILADKYYYTNNTGSIDACLENGITEGCNVQFDCINLATVNDLPTIDTTIIDGSTNPVNGNAVFDGLALKLNLSGGSLSGALNEAKGANIASAATTDIGAATGNLIHITGTTTITSFGTVQAGTERTIVFDDALTITHNVTSLILPNGYNILTAANDIAVFVSEGGGVWRLLRYQRYNDSWTTYSPTLTGFSVVPTGFTARYILNGKTCMISFNSTGVGTSNATSITMTLPFVAAAVDFSSFPYCIDNNVLCYGGGLTTAGSNVINILKNGASSWTSSGNKRISGIIIYQIQ